MFFTTNELNAELEKQISRLGVPAGLVTTGAAPVPDNFPDTDPQTLYVRYPSLYERNNYLADEVKIESSVRSLQIPYTSVAIYSLLNEINPNLAYIEAPFFVNAAEPGKTFLEKVFLLHEEFGKPDKSKIRFHRMSRHLYDLGNIMHTSFGREALSDFNLYDYLIKHREWYHRISWVDYQSLERTTLSFIPPAEVLDIYRQDYMQMQEQMIYGDTIPFDDLIDQLKNLQGEFRKTK